MHPVIRRIFSTYPFYDRLRYRQKINRIGRENPAVFRQRLDRRRELDIVQYWRAYGVRLNLTWHRAYAVVHPSDDVHRYIPEDVYFAHMERKLNRFDLAEAYTDKNNYDRLFPGVATPPVLLRRMHNRYYDIDYQALDPAEAAAIVGRAAGRFIIKPSIASGDGANVRKLHIDAGGMRLGEDKTDFAKLTELYGGDFLIQAAFEQHPAIAEFHPQSVNTTRIYTFRLDNDIHIASAVLRLGDRGRAVDNGGIPCGIGADGRLNHQAVTKYFFKHDVHPFTKKPFQGFVLPSWNLACEFVTRLHRQLPYFDTVSWDIAIGRDAVPTLIEFNLCYQDVSFLQVNNGPLFGDRTEQILSHVFQRGPATESHNGRGKVEPTSGWMERDAECLSATESNDSRAGWRV